ncbi:MAG: amidohydrolase family protein [Clostridia bacterium]|nr:amidohydrolase family protein [Clostridia bacterium]
MIIDFHVHCFPDELAQKAIPKLSENANIPARLDGTLGSLQRSMNKCGVDYSVILSIATNPLQTEKVNSWSAGVQNGGILAFGSIHPDYENWKSEIDRIKEFGLRGLKFHPDYQNFFVDDIRVFPIYEYALQQGLIIIFHCGEDPGLPLPSHCTPKRLKDVIKAFPKGKVVAAHMGGYSYWDDVERYLVGEDLYMDTSASMGFASDEQIKRIISDHGYQKILFGTDSPWSDQEEQIAKLKELNLAESVEKAILGYNAKELLGL